MLGLSLCSLILRLAFAYDDDKGIWSQQMDIAAAKGGENKRLRTSIVAAVCLPSFSRQLKCVMRRKNAFILYLTSVFAQYPIFIYDIGKIALLLCLRALQCIRPWIFVASTICFLWDQHKPVKL